MLDEHYMKLAIDKVKEGIRLGQTPFGCLIVKENNILSVAHNTVWKDRDPTAHAEVNAIRMAAKALQTIDLSGSTLYTTCEPCPMCLTASHWAKIDCVVFGATIADAESAGFSELTVSAETMIREGKSPLKIRSGVLQSECAALFPLFLKTGLGSLY